MYGGLRLEDARLHVVVVRRNLSQSSSGMGQGLGIAKRADNCSTAV